MANQKSISNGGNSGDTTILDVQSTDRIAVFDFALTAAGATVVVVKDGTGTVFGTYTFKAADSPLVVGCLNGGERFTTGDLIINSSNAVSVTGHFTYTAK